MIFRSLLYIVVIAVLVVAGSVMVARFGCGIPIVKDIVSDTCRVGAWGEIEQISELSTAVATNQVIIEETDAGGILQGTLPGFLTDQTVLVVVVGDVRAGVDLEKMGERDITVSEKGRVTVDLPEAEIFTVTLDENETRVLNSESGLLRALDNDNELVEEARRGAVQEIEATARRNDIIEVANANAEETIRAILKNSGFDDVEFE